MKVYLINLDGDNERLEWMRSQLDGQGLAWERVAGIDLRGKAGERSIREWAHLPRATLSPAEIGCMMSHAKCWQNIIDSGDELGCVLEDDILLGGPLSKLLNDDGWIPRNLGLVRLETNNQELSVATRAEASNYGIDIKATFDNWHGAAGYIITAQRARQLLHGLESSGVPVDIYMYDMMPATVVYQMVPALCIQEKWISDRSCTPSFQSHLVATRTRHKLNHPRLIDDSEYEKRRNWRGRIFAKLRRIALKIKLNSRHQRVTFIGSP